MTEMETMSSQKSDTILKSQEHENTNTVENEKLNSVVLDQNHNPGPSIRVHEDFVKAKQQNFLIDLKNNKNKSEKYTNEMCKILKGEELNITYLQKEGFTNPIFVKNTDGLHMKVPSKDSKMLDLQVAFGPSLMVDITDMFTQKRLKLTLQEWYKYFATNIDERSDVLLSISPIEVTRTKIDVQIIAPYIVRQIDWVEQVWPRQLKKVDSGSSSPMMYPEVQKFIAMSVKESWMDFHIDIGGTSAWYHIVKGKQIFWLVPPTDENLRHYEEWVSSGKKSDMFFGDIVDNCQRFEISEGGTFFIPSAWIYGVYTLEDSISIIGNFLHSFSIEKQLQVAHIEEVTNTEEDSRFPFFTEMLWYMLDRYIHCVTGKSYLSWNDTDETVNEPQVNPPTEKVYLTQPELFGIKFSVMFLHHLPVNKKNVPSTLRDPISLIKDVCSLVRTQGNTSNDEAITGQPVLRWATVEKIPKETKNETKPNETSVSKACEDNNSKLKSLGDKIDRDDQTATAAEATKESALKEDNPNHLLSRELPLDKEKLLAQRLSSTSGLSRFVQQKAHLMDNLNGKNNQKIYQSDVEENVAPTIKNNAGFSSQPTSLLHTDTRAHIPKDGLITQSDSSTENESSSDQKI